MNSAGGLKIPDFFIVGAPKCGTTAMYEFLRSHPQIFMPEFKEPHFFGDDMKMPSNRRTAKWYASLFENAGTEVLIGEASPSYLFSKTAAREIREYNRKAKIIIMVRNPVEMLYSDYYHRLAVRFESVKNFEEAVFSRDEKADRYREKVEKKLGMKQPPYLELPRLGEQTKRYLDVFGRENVHIIIFDEYKKNNGEAYRRVLNFLGADDTFQPEFSTVNQNKKIRSMLVKNLLSNTPGKIKEHARKYPLLVKAKDFINRLNIVHFERPEMDAGVKNRLKSEFASDVALLSELAGKDLSFWTA